MPMTLLYTHAKTAELAEANCCYEKDADVPILGKLEALSVCMQPRYLSSVTISAFSPLMNISTLGGCALAQQHPFHSSS